MECMRCSRREFLISTLAARLTFPAGTTSSPAKLSTGYSQKVLAKHPVAYWRLGEPKGPTAADATGSGNDGTYHGTPTYREPGAISHDPDTSVELDGRDSYIEIPDHKDFSVPASGQGLTVEVWLRPHVLTFPGETSDPHIHWVGKGGPGEYEWGFRFYSRRSSRPNRISTYVWNPAGGLGAGAYFQDRLQV